MNKTFLDVAEELYNIVELDPGTLAEHLGKLTEETGEFAAAINMVNGRKTRKKNETDEEVLDNAVEEAADIIQVVLSILKKLGVPPEQLVHKLDVKNPSYHLYLLKTYHNN